MGEAEADDVEEVDPPRDVEGEVDEELGGTWAPKAKESIVEDLGAANPNMLRLEAFSSTARSGLGTAQMLGQASEPGSDESIEWRWLAWSPCRCCCWFC
jgi:hypothetical protein